MKKTDGYQLHLASQFGICVTRPMTIGIVQHVPVQEWTWAERRRSELRWEAKKRIALFKGLGSVALALVLFVLINIPLAYAVIYIPSLLTGIAIGYLDAQLIILAWTLCEGAFDSNNVILKR